ncbi:hypothetical protein ACFWM0_24740 [Streptomyces sp. NPDC058405]|uniref:hypothetical protein n=1 Tax=unclassified Streptomyces TaxID=2593676 RepID=UPI00364B098C
MRWWIAGRSLHALLAIALVGLLTLAVPLALLYVLTEHSPQSLGDRMDDHTHLLNTTLETLRACVGTADLEPQENNTAHEVISTLASVIGAMAPATLLGVVLIKMFTVRPFVWRRRASVSHASTADFPGYARRYADSENAIIAVRFYNHLDNLAIVDLHARAHLRYLEVSPHDGTLVVYKKWLKVLDANGDLADERAWLAVERGAPFTVWIPIEAPAHELPFREIQGKQLGDVQGVKLLVRLNARAVGLGTEVVDERWFDLAADDFEIGRFVPLSPDLQTDVWSWDGWEGFDQLLPPRQLPHQRTDDSSTNPTP